MGLPLGATVADVAARPALGPERPCRSMGATSRLP